MKLLKVVKRATLGLFLAATTICGGDIAYRMLVREGAEKLKPDEIALAQTIFGDEIDYSKVRIVPHRFSMFQGRDVVVTLGNEIYYDPATKINPEPVNHFIHEMTHIWQNQHKMPNTGVRGALKLWLSSKNHEYHAAYEYEAEEGKKLTDYNMEQQADIVSYYQFLNNFLRAQKDQPQIIDIEKSESFYMKPVVDSTVVAPVIDSTLIIQEFNDQAILDRVPDGYKPMRKPKAPAAPVDPENQKRIDKTLHKNKAVRNIVHAQFNAAACSWEELEKIKVKKQFRVNNKKPVDQCQQQQPLPCLAEPVANPLLAKPVLFNPRSILQSR